MERPIGDQFNYTEYHPGLPETIAILEVTDNTGNHYCTGCYFREFCMSRWNTLKPLRGECCASKRSDNTPVIFKRIGWKH